MYIPTTYSIPCIMLHTQLVPGMLFCTLSCICICVYCIQSLPTALCLSWGSKRSSKWLHANMVLTATSKRSKYPSKSAWRASTEITWVCVLHETQRLKEESFMNTVGRTVSLILKAHELTTSSLHDIGLTRKAAVKEKSQDIPKPLLKTTT